MPTAHLAFLYPQLLRKTGTTTTTATVRWRWHFRGHRRGGSKLLHQPQFRYYGSNHYAGAMVGRGGGRHQQYQQRQQNAAFTTSAARRQATRRHGKAVEPLMLGGGGSGVAEEGMPKPPPLPPPPAPVPALSKGEAGQQQQQQQLHTKATVTQGQAVDGSARNADVTGIEAAEAQSPPHQQQQQASEGTPAEDPVAAQADGAHVNARKGGPLETILHMGPPGGGSGGHEGAGGEGQQQGGQQGVGEGEGSSNKQHPHLTPPLYVHNFDSYSLVKQLEKGGYTSAQSVTSMKAIRRLLAQNLDVAQDSLVSKSDVENETYLFRAACSELGTEVKNNRRIADEELRQKRTFLQHEVDILSQSLSQELLTLNDNVRGMFNDRKIAVREEQKAVESTIQQINYKISISLSSDAKSEIEGLRWVLIRRSVIGILFMAVLTLGALRYGTYVGHKSKKEAERVEKQAELLRSADGKKDHSSAPDAAEILAAN